MLLEHAKLAFEYILEYILEPFLKKVKITYCNHTHSQHASAYSFSIDREVWKINVFWKRVSFSQELIENWE